MFIFPNLRTSPLFHIVLLITLAFLLPSCYNTKKIVYLQGSFDTARLSRITLPESVIQKGDILGITVFSDNPMASALYNQGGQPASPSVGISAASSSAAETSTPAAASGGSSGAGYWVDDQGFIELPGIGSLHVQDLTRQQLKDTLDSKLKPYLKNPYYTIRFLNKRVVVLGEVSRPGVLSMSGDHMSLFEALSLAGDMTFYARRDNILVIREKDNKREFARLDITKPEILESPYFYLQQNDVLIVEPTVKKVATNDQVTIRNIGIASTVLSVVVIFVTLFRK